MFWAIVFDVFGVLGIMTFAVLLTLAVLALIFHKKIKAGFMYARSAYNSIQLLRTNSSLFKPAPLERMRGE